MEDAGRRAEGRGAGVPESSASSPPPLPVLRSIVGIIFYTSRWRTTQNPMPLPSALPLDGLSDLEFPEFPQPATRRRHLSRPPDLRDTSSPALILQQTAHVSATSFAPMDSGTSLHCTRNHEPTSSGAQMVEVVGGEWRTSVDAWPKRRSVPRPCGVRGINKAEVDAATQLLAFRDKLTARVSIRKKSCVREASTDVQLFVNQVLPGRPLYGCPQKPVLAILHARLEKQKHLGHVHPHCGSSVRARHHLFGKGPISGDTGASFEGLTCTRARACMVCICTFTCL